MKISVYSLKHILYEGDGESLNCKTTSGEITILANHLPLITVLSEGNLKIIDNEKKEKFIPIKSGFLEVKTKSEIRCLVDQ